MKKVNYLSVKQKMTTNAYQRQQSYQFKDVNKKVRD